MKLFVALAGNMGAGKTTLARLISSRFGWQPFFEPVEENPYLKDFYNDMQRWALHSQLFFLSRRLDEHWQLANQTISVIQDRSLYENAEVFARNAYEQGFINERDWCVYQNLYKTMVSIMPPPSIIIYLRASVPVLIERLVRRGNDYEKNVKPKYLEGLNNLYEKWISECTMPKYIIETDGRNFPDDPRELETVINEISSAIGGLQEKLIH